MDLAKYFGRVNHDVLMERLSRRITDRRVLGLICRYPVAGALAEGVVVERHEGTPQGGPPSPLLANALLEEVDKAMEKWGLTFAHYTDDLNVYTGSRRAQERGGASVGAQVPPAHACWSPHSGRRLAHAGHPALLNIRWDSARPG